jgi:hypothetical protein
VVLLAVEKRIEIRDPHGTLIDTIPLGTWAGPMATVDSNTVLAALPCDHAIARVGIAGRTVEHRPLGRFRHPWALTRIPGGWAASSATSKEIALLSEELEEERFVMTPSAEPWNSRVRGVPALLYHPPMKCLLAADPDNLRIVKVTLDGVSVGTFAGGGLEYGEILSVVDLARDAGGGLVVTQGYAPCGECTMVKLLDADSRMVGSVGYFASGRLEHPVLSFPYGGNELISYDSRLGGPAVSDRSNRIVKAVSGWGWGSGLVAGVPGGEDGRGQGFVFDRGYGGFVADLARRRVVRYSTDLRMVEELVPPGDDLLFTPVAMTLDAVGNLHVLDGLRNVVLRFGRRRAWGESKDGYRYVYDRQYRAPGDAPLQRLYTQADRVVGVDVFGCRGYRFSNGGWPVDSFALPPTFVASSRWTENGEGELVILDQTDPKVVVITEAGDVAFHDGPGPAADVLVFESLDRWIGWRWGRVPRGARYVCLSSSLDARYLDERFVVKK